MRSRRDDRECRSVDSGRIVGDAGIGAVVSFAFDVVVVLVEVEMSVVVAVVSADDPRCYHVLTLKKKKMKMKACGG